MGHTLREENTMPGIPFEEFDDIGIVWPEPRPDPDAEPVDHHLGPLDDPRDKDWLRNDDPRRRNAT